MPTVTINYEDFCQILGRRIKRKRLLEDLDSIKCEVQSVNESEITIEVTTDRPDLFSTAGIAVALKGIEDIEVGLPKIKVERSTVVVRVDESVKEVRPFVAFSEVREIQLSDEAVRQIMQLQEKLHETYCRHRRKVSIGIHNADAITTRIKYEALKPSEIKFIPLGEQREMSGDEILSSTPKGIEYGHIIEDFDRYPLLTDDRGTVLSMPPIINSIHTVVSPGVRNLFIDVTGTDKKLVNNVLNLVTFALVQRGEVVRSVKRAGPDGTAWTPKLAPTERELRVRYARDVLGLDLSADQTRDCLLRMRFGAEIDGEDRLKVLVPFYRHDVLHEIDLVEDVLIAYGYGNVKPEVPSIATIGREIETVEQTRAARDIMVGFGFQEVLNYMMTNKDDLVKKMRLGRGDVVEVANPVSRTYSVLRNWLLPGLIRFLSTNKHTPYPQRIFECGDVVLIDKESETGTRGVTKLAAVISDSKVSYEDVQAVLFSLLPSLGIRKWSTKPIRHRSFIEGRCANVFVGAYKLGILGEIHPEVLNNFDLEMPSAGLEVNLRMIQEMRRSSG